MPPLKILHGFVNFYGDLKLEDLLPLLVTIFFLSLLLADFIDASFSGAGFRCTSTAF